MLGDIKNKMVMGSSKSHICQLDDIDGAVRQRCIHLDTKLQELDDLLSEYDMKRDLVEINRKAPSGRTKQSGTNGTWNRKQASL